MPVTAGAIAAIGQTGLGIGQMIGASRRRKKAMARLQKNPFQVPGSLTRSVEMQGKMAQGSQMPGQDIMEEQLASGTATAVNQARRSATSPSQVMQATIDSYLAQQQQQQQLDIQAAQENRMMQQNYANAVAQIAPYEQKAWEYNVLAPVQADLNAAAMQQQAGMQNIGQGISSGLTTFGNQQYLQGLGGGTDTGSTATAPGMTNQQTMQTLQTGMMNKAYQPPMLNTGSLFAGGLPPIGV